MLTRILDKLMRSTLRLAGLAIIAIAGLIVFARKPFSNNAQEQVTQAPVSDQGSRAHKPDPARSRRLAERLLGISSPNTMIEAARDGESNFRQMVDSFRPDDFAGVLKELSRLEGNRRDSAIAELRLKLLLVWTAKDPAASSSFAFEEAVPADACRVIAETWAKSDPDAALAWARGSLEGDRRQASLVGIGHLVALDHPQQAIELAIEAGASSETDDLLNQATSAWAAKDPQAALNWANAVKDASLKSQLIAAVAMSWADRDPNAAAGLVIDAINDDSLTENAIVGIVQRIAFQDLPWVREWVAEFPAGRMRDRAEMELSRIEERTGT